MQQQKFKNSFPNICHFLSFSLYLQHSLHQQDNFYCSIDFVVKLQIKYMEKSTFISPPKSQYEDDVTAWQQKSNDHQQQQFKLDTLQFFRFQNRGNTGYNPSDAIIFSLGLCFQTCPVILKLEFLSIDKKSNSRKFLLHVDGPEFLRCDHKPAPNICISNR